MATQIDTANRWFGYRITAVLSPADRLVPPSGTQSRAYGFRQDTWMLSGTDGEDPRMVALTDARELELREGGFPSAELAERQGARVLEAMRVVCLQGISGLDFGDRSTRGWVLIGEEMWAQADVEDKPEEGLYRGDLGLQVFEEVPGMRFARPWIRRTHDIPVEPFLSALRARLERGRAMGERERVSCGLLHAARFEPDSRARFLLAVVAIEALIAPAPRSPEAVAFIKSAVENLAASKAIPPNEKQSITAQLGYMVKESIARTGRNYAKNLLGRKKYWSRMRPENFFNHVYTTRSDLVHYGYSGGLSILEFERYATHVERFARDLLLAQLERPEPPPSEKPGLSVLGAPEPPEK